MITNAQEAAALSLRAAESKTIGPAVRIILQVVDGAASMGRRSANITRALQTVDYRDKPSVIAKLKHLGFSHRAYRGDQREPGWDEISW